jgi:serine/threonine protein kinase
MRMKELDQSSGITCRRCGSRLGTGVLASLCPQCLFQQGLGTPCSCRPKSFVAPSLSSIASLVPGVELLELVGQGGMGAVYKGRQHLLNRLVAVKVLPATAADGGSIVSRFRREARVLARLNNPNVVAIYDYGSAGGLSYFTMDYVEGCTLRQMLKVGQLEPERAVDLFCQLCDGLQHAHERGVVHRDIKPENLLIDKRGRLKVADFGIATLKWDGPSNERPTLEGQRIGTPYYMAPEQAQRPHTVDHRADIYSAGAVLYEMLTGVLPLGRFAPPSGKARIPLQMDMAVLGALETEASARYPSIEEFKAAVQSAWGVLAADGKSRSPSDPAALSQAAEKLEQGLGSAVLRAVERSGSALCLPVLKFIAAQEADEGKSSSPSGQADWARRAEKLEQELGTDRDPANAFERLKEIYTQLDREEDIIRASQNLIRAYALEGRLAAAILESQNLLLRLPPESAVAGSVRHDMGNWNSLLEAQEALLEHKPEMYRMAEMLKHSYSKLDIEDKVESISRKLARAYMLKKKWPQAREEYREILQRNPDDGDIKQALAQVESMAAQEAAAPPTP